jgi:hypothetical protein
MHFGEWNRARPHLWRSLQHRPAQHKALVLLFFSMMPVPVFRAALEAKRRLRALNGARIAALFGKIAILGWLDPILSFAGDIMETAVLPV